MESHSTYQSLSDFLVEEFLGKERLLFIQLSFCTKNSGEKNLSHPAPLCSSQMFVPWWVFFSALMISISKAAERSLPLLWDLCTQQIALLCYTMSPLFLHQFHFLGQQEIIPFFIGFLFYILSWGGVAYMHCPIFRTCPKTLMLTASYFDVAFRSHIYVLLARHHATAVMNAL